MARKTRDKIPTSVRMDKDNYKWCEQEAERERQSLSYVVNRVLMLHIAKEQNESRKHN